MSTKRAVDYDENAERPSRPKPTNREAVCYNQVSGGSENVTYTKDQTVRSHELAVDAEAKAQGAIVAGNEPGFANAKRRAASVLKNRKATAAVFEANRKKSSKV